MTNTEGWIPHDGGEMPCDGKLVVDVRFRCGIVDNEGHQATYWRWERGAHESYNIAFWRPHKNADRQAGQDDLSPPFPYRAVDSITTDTAAPPQEGHAAGPACSAPDEALVKRLTAMLEQMGNPDYSLKEFVRGVADVRDALAAQGGEQSACPTKGKLCKSCAEEAARILGRLDLDMQDGKCDPTPADCAEALLEAAMKGPSTEMVSVPRDPTEQMIDAGFEACSKQYCLEPFDDTMEKTLAVYHAMITAAKEVK